MEEGYQENLCILRNPKFYNHSDKSPPQIFIERHPNHFPVL